MDKHTQGPWKAEISTNGFAASGWVAKVCGNYDGDCGDDLATVTTAFAPGGREIPREEWAANARLLAAAPDMLEALKMIRDGCGPDTWEGQKACAAIAKAEGR